MSISHKKMTATGIITNRSCHFMGFLVDTDGTNDPTIAIHSGTTATGNEIIPTNTTDASVLNLDGFMVGEEGIRCENGLYLTMTVAGAGAAEVVVYYK